MSYSTRIVRLTADERCTTGSYKLVWSSASRIARSVSDPDIVAISCSTCVGNRLTSNRFQPHPPIRITAGVVDVFLSLAYRVLLED